MSAANDCTLDAFVLNPCPFCGEKPRDIKWDDDEGTKWSAALRCSNTECVASGPMTGWYRVKREALEWAVGRWNHRIENATAHGCDTEPVREAVVLGGLLLYGRLAGGPRQDLRLLHDGGHRRLQLAINGDAPQPTSETALLALLRRELRRVLSGG